MPVNWPPPTAKAWPPKELKTSWLSCSCLRAFLDVMRELGFKNEAPTTAKADPTFADVRCDEGHQVIGRTFISPTGERFWIAVCTDAKHQDVLVPWPPYYCGFGSRENIDITKISAEK